MFLISIFVSLQMFFMTAGYFLVIIIFVGIFHLLFFPKVIDFIKLWMVP